MKKLKEVLLTAPQPREMFFLGMTTGLLVLSLLQDWIGKETYLQLAEEHWVSGYFSVPFAIIALLYIAFRLATFPEK
jgi:hypothetical protein